jgi:hypothetical protein
MVARGRFACAVFEPVADVRLAVVWDGGDTATVHTVDDGRWGPAIESWSMLDEHGWPRIACTPSALEELARFRLEETPGAAELVATAAAVLGVGAPAGR